MAGLRILVCGGRDFTNKAAVWQALDRLHAKRPIAAIIQGTSRGADTLAAEWGWERGITVCSFPADWDQYGRRAGTIRNQRMLDEGKPDGVVAFPGGVGTADMTRRARAAGLTVWEPIR